MGKNPARLKVVVYSLSPFQQKVMPGLWKGLPDKIHKKVSKNWISAGLLLTPLVGTYLNENVGLTNQVQKPIGVKVPDAKGQ